MPEHLWVDHLSTSGSCLGPVLHHDVAVVRALRGQKILWRHSLHLQNVGVAPLPLELLKRESVREIHRQKRLGEFDPVCDAVVSVTEKRM